MLEILLFVCVVFLDPLKEGGLLECGCEDVDGAVLLLDVSDGVCISHHLDESYLGASGEGLIRDYPGNEKG